VNNPQSLETLENGAEAPTIFSIPSRDIDFFEENGSVRSDRYHLDGFNVTITSDNNPSGLAPRTAAIRVPASAGENFVPLRVVVSSDTRSSTPGTAPSDAVRVVQAVGGGAALQVVIDTSKMTPNPFAEPADEATSERFNFTIPAVMFDLEEPPSETGGRLGVISDYFDLPAIQGFFLSSQNSQDYSGLLNPNGQINETEDEGAELSYDLRFDSNDFDSPEPGPIVLLSTGLLSVGVVIWRERVRKRRVDVRRE
jgi:hypothetical protein